MDEGTTYRVEEMARRMRDVYEGTSNEDDEARAMLDAAIAILRDNPDVVIP